MNKSEEIRKRARAIIGNTKIETIISDAEIITKISDIINADSIDVKKADIMINQIELYITLKQKIEQKEENFNYLKDLSKDLKEQRIRKEDKDINVPLFKVNKDKKSYYFLTRSKAQEFINANKDTKIDGIQLEENSIEKLEQLLETIKNNF